MISRRGDSFMPVIIAIIIGVAVTAFLFWLLAKGGGWAGGLGLFGQKSLDTLKGTQV